MSIFTQEENVERPARLRNSYGAANTKCPIMNRDGDLLDDLKDRPLAMARSRTGQQSANSLNGLATTANHSTNVPSPKLQLKDCCSAVWNFRQHHVVRKFNDLANDKLEKLSHAPERLTTNEHE